MIGWFGIDYEPLTRLWSVPAGFSFSEKNTFPELLDMHLAFLVFLVKFGG
jgi:hypothetical protein